jgi:hypothetical protein
LPLSFLAEFARAGRRYWPNAGDGTVIDDIPLGLSDAALRKGWTRQHGEDAPAIEAAYRHYGPLARRVLDVLMAANPLLAEADLAWGHDRRPGTRVDVTRAVELLHAYALIVNDGMLPCGGRALVRFMWDQESHWDDPAHWITEALAQGRLDVAVAFGAGDYAVTGEAAVLERARADLRDLDTALAWWARCPEFCRRVDPDIERVAGIPEFPALAKLADPLKHGMHFINNLPDVSLLSGAPRLSCRLVAAGGPARRRRVDSLAGAVRRHVGRRDASPAGGPDPGRVPCLRLCAFGADARSFAPRYRDGVPASGPEASSGQGRPSGGFRPNPPCAGPADFRVGSPARDGGLLNAWYELI